MADCLDILSHGGVLQRGRLFVLVCIVLLNPGSCVALTRSPGNTQAAVNYMLSVSVYIPGVPAIILVTNQ